jgi:hypothetical protein
MISFLPDFFLLIDFNIFFNLCPVVFRPWKVMESLVLGLSSKWALVVYFGWSSVDIISMSLITNLGIFFRIFTYLYFFMWNLFRKHIMKKVDTFLWAKWAFFYNFWLSVQIKSSPFFKVASRLFQESLAVNFMTLNYSLGIYSLYDVYCTFRHGTVSNIKIHTFINQRSTNHVSFVFFASSRKKLASLSK